MQVRYAGVMEGIHVGLKNLCPYGIARSNSSPAPKKNEGSIGVINQ